MTADQNLFAAANGVGQNPDGTPNNVALSWRWVRVRGRQILKGLISTGSGPQLPFAWPNANYPASVSTYDSVTGTAEQVASRFIDPYGNVVNFMTVWVTDWLWKLDGCPTPLTQQRLSQYLQLANQLNPWPANYAGIDRTKFPNEDYATYPPWPPTTPVPLDSFLPTSSTSHGSNTAGTL